MSEVWPLDVKERLQVSPGESLRPFKTILLMPFESRFNQVADVIKQTVEEVVQNFAVQFSMENPIVNRLDWVTSSGVIQQQIWQEILEADLIFCDITGFNPNVMFEAGVCASWKNMTKVAFIKDRYFRQQSAFDIAPIRYAEYELTSDGINHFKEMVAKLTTDALIAFPDKQGSTPIIRLPLNIEFSGGHDDMRLFTPPFSHRRVIDESLEFGSVNFFSHSWASIGKEKYLNFNLEFRARFVEPMIEVPKIGVGLRSQHYFANFGHLLSLNSDGSIWITEPNHNPPQFYEDIKLRDPVSIDLEEYHHFRVSFNNEELMVSIGDFAHSIQIKNMDKVFGPGIIRLYSVRCLMGVKSIHLDKIT